MTFRRRRRARPTEAVRARAKVASEGARPIGQPTTLFANLSLGSGVHFGGVHRRLRWSWPLRCRVATLRLSEFGMNLSVSFLARPTLSIARWLRQLFVTLPVLSTPFLYLLFILAMATLISSLDHPNGRILMPSSHIVPMSPWLSSDGTFLTEPTWRISFLP